MTDNCNLYFKECMEVETVFTSYVLVYDEEKATKNVIHNTEKLRSSTPNMSTPVGSKNKQVPFLIVSNCHFIGPRLRKTLPGMSKSLSSSRHKKMSGRINDLRKTSSVDGLKYLGKMSKL